MSINTRLSDLLDHMLDLQLALGQRLPEAELTRAGAADNWSLKDNLAHSAEWAGRNLDELEALERGEAWPEHVASNFDDENQVVFELHEHKSWDEVRAILRGAYGRGQAYLNRVGEERLLALLPDEPQRPIWRNLAGNYVLHPMIHVWEYLAQNGHGDLLDELFGEAFARQLLALSDDSGWQGTTLYNQACILARSGQTEQAIEQLAEALMLEPGLTEWSREDSDLDSLRDNPAFQALYD